MDVLTPKANRTSIRVEGDHVLLISDGVLLMDMPYQVAIEIGRLLIAQGKQAETHAKRDQVVLQQAMLMRLSLPFGFIPRTRPDLMHMAGNEAAWNTDLRRRIRERPDTFGEVYAPEVSQEDAPGK